MIREYEGIEKKQNISASALAAFVLSIVAPFSRFVLFGRGLLIITMYIVIPLLLIHVMQKRTLTISLSSINALMFFMLGWIALSILLSHGSITGITIDSCKVQICSFALFCCAINAREERTLNSIYIIISIAFILLYLYNGVQYLGGARYRIELQTGLFLDPNMVAGSFIIPACLLTKVLMDKEKRAIARIFAVVVLLGMLYVSLLGASRGGLLACAVCVAVTVLSRRNSITKRFAFVFFGVLVLVLFFAYFVRNNIASELIGRFTLEDVRESGGSGRLNIYFSYLDYMFTKGSPVELLFGYGIGTGQHIIGKASHSTPLDFLWGLGIIGFVFYVYFTVKLIKYCVKSKSDVAIACIVGVEIWSISLSLSNQFSFWAFLYYCISIASNEYIKDSYQFKTKLKVKIAIWRV